MSPDPPKNIVIVGGGIIGCTSAYFLSHHPSFSPSQTKITLLEATSIASGASGKAGGLLALWAYPSCIVPLSYRLHKELAEKHDGANRWGYRGVHCGQVEARATTAADGGALNDEKNGSVSLQKRSKESIAQLKAAGVPKDLDWLLPESVDAYEEMGTPDTTAQVHPYQFTTSMASLAQEKGVEIILGSVTSINKSSNAVESVTYTLKDSSEERTIPADTVILSAGPWTKTLLPEAPISALRAHSVTIRPSRPVSAYALFTSITLPSSSKPKKRSETVTPEIYARPNAEIYACGEGDTLLPLPPSTSLVAVDAARCQDVVDQVCSISAELADGEVTARQACYLPNVEGGGGPLVGETRTKGMVVAAGHTCWGIQNAPGTGCVVSEVVWEGRVRSAEVGSLDPGRFM
ncbi:FAD dependent oxidoreductase [Aulographum hederae CBS 113979]|uniref:FAD dependent oxidoreductase n=1 Tax=Aulographum hederae CBS 113979 TaxID=1176131 RepID=A0A6G1HAA8_9PEZI|nr:FAD dependent oxidoreductase [Aulographum hederae CBS 113979]